MSMRAVLIKGDTSASADGLYIGDVERPKPKAGEVLVRIVAFGINRMDIMQRQGNYPVPAGASSIMGVELSGYIEDPNGTSWKKGDEVYGLTRGGAYSEFIAVRQGMIVPKPKEISFVHAAAICENYLTAFQCLSIAEVKEGDTVLVHAGASGVGLAAIQIAKTLGAKSIIATAGSDDKISFVKKYAQHGINYKKQDFEDEVSRITNKRGVDVILDFVGKDYWERNIASLAIDGRMVLIGMLSGAMLDKPTSLGPILYKRLRIQGTTLRARSDSYQEKLLQDMLAADLLRTSCNLVIHKEYSWKDIVQVHQDMEDAKNIGKLVCVVD